MCSRLQLRNVVSGCNFRGWCEQVEKKKELLKEDRRIHTTPEVHASGCDSRDGPYFKPPPIPPTLLLHSEWSQSRLYLSSQFSRGLKGSVNIGQSSRCAAEGHTNHFRVGAGAGLIGRASANLHARRRERFTLKNNLFQNRRVFNRNRRFFDVISLIGRRKVTSPSQALRVVGC